MQVPATNCQLPEANVQVPEADFEVREMSAEVLEANNCQVLEATFQSSWPLGPDSRSLDVAAPARGQLRADATAAFRRRRRATQDEAWP